MTFRAPPCILWLRIQITLMHQFRGLASERHIVSFRVRSEKNLVMISIAFSLGEDLSFEMCSTRLWKEMNHGKPYF